MAKFCSNCGNEIIVGEKFCTNCGYSIDYVRTNDVNPVLSINEKLQPTPLISTQKEQTTPYPVVRMYPNARAGIIFAIFGMLISIAVGVYLVGTFFITFALGIYLVRCILTVSAQAYRVKCPSCETEIFFPIDKAGCTCPACQKRLVMKDGTVKIIV